MAVDAELVCFENPHLFTSLFTVYVNNDKKASNYLLVSLYYYVHGMAMTSLQWRQFIGTNNILSVRHKNCDFIGDRKIGRL